MSRPFEKLKEEIKKEILQLSFPIGQPYVTQTDTNPSTILGFGTWERVKGRVLVGLDENDTEFNTIGKTGGETEHVLTENELAGHEHLGLHYSSNETPVSFKRQTSDIVGYGLDFQSNATIYTATNIRTNSAGGGEAHNNLQPYRVVGYMWIRTE